MKRSPDPYNLEGSRTLNPRVDPHMRSCANKSYLCMVFSHMACSFFNSSSPGRFLAGNGALRIQFERFFLPKLKIRLQTEVMTSWVQLLGGFCSFPWFSTTRSLFWSSIYKGNMKKNQGNEQNPPNNCTQEIITSVWSRIFNFGKKNLSNWMRNAPFPARKRPGDEELKP